MGLTEKDMQVLRAPARKNEAQGQASFGMANLRRKTTGLPFIVFISQKDEARHAAHVKLRADEMSSYSIAPFEWKEGPRLSTAEEKLLGRWIHVNSRVLLGYWNGDIEYTEDAIEQLKGV